MDFQRQRKNSPSWESRESSPWMLGFPWETHGSLCPALHVREPRQHEHLESSCQSVMSSLMLSGWCEYSHWQAVAPRHGSALCRHINNFKQSPAWKQIPLASAQRFGRAECSLIVSLPGTKPPIVFQVITFFSLSNLNCRGPLCWLGQADRAAQAEVLPRASEWALNEMAFTILRTLSQSTRLPPSPAQEQFPCL